MLPLHNSVTKPFSSSLPLCRHIILQKTTPNYFSYKLTFNLIRFLDAHICSEDYLLFIYRIIVTSLHLSTRQVIRNQKTRKWTLSFPRERRKRRLSDEFMRDRATRPLNHPFTRPSALPTLPRQSHPRAKYTAIDTFQSAPRQSSTSPMLSRPPLG